MTADFAANYRANLRDRTLASAAKRPCAPADLVDSEAVFAQNDFAWRGRAEALDAQHVTRVADIAVPPLPRPRFDCQPRAHRGRQHGVALDLPERVEELPARHRDAAHRHTLRTQTLRSGDNQADFRAAGDQNQFGFAAFGIE